MQINKHFLKRITPPSLWAKLSATYWWWHNRGRHLLALRTSPIWETNRKQLQPYKDQHQGERCFILGNGPSLNHTDLLNLKDEVTFGLNRIYLLFPKIGFSTTYLVSVNDLVLEQCANELRTLILPKFITWRARRWFTGDPNTYFLDTDYTGSETFNPNITSRIYEGFTVTYVAMQIAFYMGFDEVILVGVDHNFETTGTPNTVVVSRGEDPNHFAPDYFGAGFKWQLPDLIGSEKAYRLARDAYQHAGRKIVDATIGGKLQVFPKVDYESLFKGT